MGSAIVSSSIGPGGLLKVLKILSLVIVFIMLKEFIRQLCFARLNTKAAFGVDASAALIQLTGLSILVYIGLLSAEIVFAISGVACGLTVSWWLIANKDVFILQLKKALPDFHQNWSFVKWVVASHILWASAMSLYPWLIAAFLGVEANGVWAACLSIIMIGNLICVAVQNMLGPKIVYAQARGAVSELRSTVFRSAFYFSLIMIAICLVFVSMGNFLVVFFYGQEYDGNGAIVSLLAMNLVVQSTTFPFSRGLFALERTDIDFVVNMAVVLSLIVGIWLIRSYDLIGAALGVLAANSLSTLLRGIAFARLTTTECPTVKTEARKKAGLT
jgi:O-antigen/teichoic acid export membrane protein